MSSLTANRSILSQLWYRTKAKIKFLFSSGATKAFRTTIVRPSPFGKLPREIVEEILSYFICDIRNLLACSLTCRSWYLATVSHLHYSLTTDESPYASEDKDYHWPGPLEKMYDFGLLRLVKRFRIRHSYGGRRFTPEDLGGRNLYYFSALKNLQELGIDNLQVSSFIPGLRQYFGHLSPTLRFLALSEPIGSSRQIVYFIGLFPNLQDLKLHYSDLKNGHENVVDTTLIPLSSPPLRGRLTLIFFTREQIVKDMITLFGGLRFHHMDLFGVKCLPLLLEKCAETLETLRLYPTDPYAKRMCFNLSQNKVLRTLETTAESIVIAGDGFLKTVLSSVASPGILEVVIIYRENDLGGWPPRQSCKPDPVYFPDYLLGVWCFPYQLMVFREMHSVRDFRLVFCVDVHGCMVDVGMEILGSIVEMEWAGGRFGSLVCKPVVIYERRTIRTRFTDEHAGSRWKTVFASAL